MKSPSQQRITASIMATMFVVNIFKAYYYVTKIDVT